MKRSAVMAIGLALTFGTVGYGDSPSDHSFLVGTWINIAYLSGEQSDMLAFVISEPKPGELFIRAYGNCMPTPCDLGVVPCTDYARDIGSNLAEGFTALYQLDFKQVILAGVRVDIPRWDLIQLHAFHFYYPPDGRSDRYKSEYFLRVD